MRDERLARYLATAERRQMRRVLLAVYHFYFVTAQVPDERGQRHFRGVRDVGEHGFAEEHLAERDAVQAAHALAFEPCFDAVRVSHAMPYAPLIWAGVCPLIDHGAVAGFDRSVKPAGYAYGETFSAQ